MSRRQSLAGALVVVGLLLTGACGQQGVGQPTTVVGRGGRQVTVLVDEHVTSAVTATFVPFLNGRPGRVVWGSGPADVLATTIKYGYRIDAVVLPSGTALDRVRDELAGRPVSIGVLGNAAYWAAPITVRGVPFAAFLAGRAGSRLLRAHGLH